jgi:PAS domain S-box-containing protein
MTGKDKRPEQAAPSACSGQALRKRAEEIVRETAARTPENIEAFSSEEVRRSLHELQVHQIELEMQNEELRRAQVELDAARSRYFDLYDLAPISYLTVSEKGLILEANLTAATLLGMARGALVNQPITRFILKGDQDLHRKQLFETDKPQARELRMLRQDGTPFWTHLNTTTARDANGALVCRVVMSDITERKQAEERIQAALVEKEVLLREVHHRVKNNLNTIANMLYFQTKTVEDNKALAAFQDSQNRIQSMARVHEHLYRSASLAQVNMAAYFEDLAADLQQTCGRNDVSIHIDFTNGHLDIDQAIPCGLIVNELVTNSLKHAFRDCTANQRNEVTVQLITQAEQHVLEVRDNGVGLPAGMDVENSSSLGLRLVSMLTRQLKARLTVDTAQGKGTNFIVVFPLAKLTNHTC